MNSQSEEDYLKALYHLEIDFNAVSTNSIRIFRDETI